MTPDERQESTATEGSRERKKRAYPVSFGQEGLWTIHELDPGNPAYNVPMAVRIRGNLDVDALRRSLGDIVQRHEILRTTYRIHQGDPVQVVHPSEPVDLRIVDVSDGPSEERRARKRVEEAVRTPFDLRTDFPYRFRLLRLDETDHVLAVVIHHIASDLPSMERFSRELWTAYRAYVEEGEREVSGPSLQYADFAVWERDRFEAGEMDEGIEAWTDRLEGALPLDLPVDRSNGGHDSSEGDVVRFEIPEDLTSMLEAIGQEASATRFMTFLAVYKVLLSRYTRQSDIVVGAPISRRDREGAEDLIGYFVNTLPIRSTISLEDSFLDVLETVREEALETFRHKDVPFGRIVDEIDPDREWGQNPLFQATFDHVPDREADAEGRTPESLEVTSFGPGRTAAKFDLNLRVRGLDQGAIGTFRFRKATFDRETVERMADHLVELARRLSQDPDAPIGTIDYVAGEERELLLSEWSGETTDYPRGKTVPEVFAGQVRARPDAVAVRFGEEQLTYRELDAQSARIAAALRRHSLEAGALVGVCIEGRAEMIAASLGVLKAGCGYVPLDPEYPNKRLSFMLEDTGATVVLTDAASRGHLPPEGPPLLSIDELTTADEPAPAPEREVAPDDIAYVMYTSGSTGRPKGVMVDHRAIVRLVKGTNYIELEPDDAILHASNPSFDASTFEVWGPLLNGATVAAAPSEALLDPGRFRRLVRRHGVSVMFVTTALFNRLSREDPGIFGDLRRLLFGGEATNPRSVSRVLESRTPPDDLLNVYGPTENTTFTTWHPIGDAPTGGTRVPIGRPIANTSVYVLDEMGNPVPPGVPGELYTGGDGVARGYLNRPDLTGETFVEDPFSDDDDAKMYATGDLVRWTSDGDLEFLGRKDRQVKIRGHRIEPGEVEAFLTEFSHVRQAVVTVRDGGSGPQSQLVCYLVPEDSDEGVSETELETALARELPSYMVPDRFVALERFPLTANGKIDRGELPEPDPRAETEGPLVEPQTPTEQALAEIWSEVLEIDRLGVHDDFFQLGGNSLSAISVKKEVRQRFTVDLDVQTLFERPTLRHLAKTIQTEVEEKISSMSDEEAGELLARIEGDRQ